MRHVLPGDHYPGRWLVAQSGSVTAALSEWAGYEGQIPATINLGNQTDLARQTTLNIFQLTKTPELSPLPEGIKMAGAFGSAARATLRKPVAVLKAGRSETGRLAASSHTGSLAGRHEVFSGACFYNLA